MLSLGGQLTYKLPFPVQPEARLGLQAETLKRRAKVPRAFWLFIWKRWEIQSGVARTPMTRWVHSTGTTEQDGGAWLGPPQ